METWVIATGLIFLYLLATIVLGIVANRRMSGDMEDFLLYGRKAGFIVLYLTVVATFHSAFAFLGSERPVSEQGRRSASVNERRWTTIDRSASCQRDHSGEGLARVDGINQEPLESCGHANGLLGSF